MLCESALVVVTLDETVVVEVGFAAGDELHAAANMPRHVRDRTVAQRVRLGRRAKPASNSTSWCRAGATRREGTNYFTYPPS